MGDVDSVRPIEGENTGKEAMRMPRCIKHAFGAVTAEEKPLLEKCRRWKPGMSRAEFRTLRKSFRRAGLPDRYLDLFLYNRKKRGSTLTPDQYVALIRDSELFTYGPKEVPPGWDWPDD